MLTKIYGVYGRRAVELDLKVGKARMKISFTKGCLDSKNYRPATFTTGDPAVQAIIEGSAHYGTIIRLVRSIGDEVPVNAAEGGDSGNSATEKPAESSNSENSASESSSTERGVSDRSSTESNSSENRASNGSSTENRGDSNRDRNNSGNRSGQDGKGGNSYGGGYNGEGKKYSESRDGGNRHGEQRWSGQPSGRQAQPLKDKQKMYNDGADVTDKEGIKKFASKQASSR